MTHLKKANFLIKKFGVKLAIIHVDEILKITEEVSTIVTNYFRVDPIIDRNFWLGVKKEIENYKQ